VYSQSRTSQQVAAPAPASPAVSPATSNAARAEDRGLAAHAEDPALQTVVLDALPLDMALPMAWAERAQGWAREWMVGLPVAEVLADGAAWVGERVGEALDGVSVELALKGKVGVGLDVTGDASATLACAAGELALTLRSGAGLGVGFGEGVTMEGVDGDVLLGEKAEVGGAATGALTRTWRWKTAGDLLAHVDATGLTRAIASGPAALLAFVTEAALAAAEALAPDEERLQDGMKAGVEGALGFGDTASAEANASYDVAVGHEGGRPYWECRVGGKIGGGVTARFAAVAGLDGVALAAMPEVTVRLWGDVARLTRGDLACADGADLEIGDDTVTFADFGGLVCWLAAQALGEGRPVDLVAGDELPGVTLRRHVSTPAEAGSPVHELLRGAAAPYIGAGVAKVELTATTEADVAVDTAAVRAALGGESLPIGELGAEPAVLDVARAIVAHAQGSTYDPGLGVDLDLDAGVDAADIDAEAVAELEVAAGVGISGAAVLKAGVAGRAGATVTVRRPLDTETARAALA
jgi:hypothetical protein